MTPADDPEAVRRTVVIVNRRGLHARAAAKFVKLAATYACEVVVARNGTDVSGRSIMGLMMLAAGPGSELTIAASGADAADAVAGLVRLVAGGFDED